MREILFKAKRKDTGEWIEGDLSQDRDLETCYIQGFNYYSNDSGLQRETFCFEVDPKTVCQFTGLHDKDEKRIWEKDIVKCDKRGAAFFHSCVVWNDTKGRYDVIAMDCLFPITLDSQDDISIHGRDYEVIGNLYEEN